MEDDKLDYLDARVELLEAKVAALDAMLGRALDILHRLAPLADAADAAEAAPQSQPQPNGPKLELVSVSTKPTESNSTWTKWAWRLVVKNNSLQPVLFEARIQFRDADSFALDEHTSDTLRIDPSAESVFTDYRMVDASIAHLIDSVHATLSWA